MSSLDAALVCPNPKVRLKSQGRTTYSRRSGGRNPGSPQDVDRSDLDYPAEIWLEIPPRDAADAP